MSVIKSSREIDRVFRASTTVTHPHLIALIAPTPEGRGPEGRVAFIAGKRLGGAVTRNRAKRILRAALRESGRSWPGKDVALIATPSTLIAPHEAVLAAFAKLDRRIGGQT